ncbi:MAG: type I methionyl aminopeptidase [Acidobacteria bacterium]|nr:MAG: type I methionyl aminopeptidase [Acidobacteriota bacterium]
MKRAGLVVYDVLSRITDAVRPGISTRRLDQIADDCIRKAGAIPSFKGYRGYPASVCTSPNEVVVHGIPDDYRLRDGDIIGVDCGAILDGWHGDAAVTLPVGDVSDEAAELISVTRHSLAAGIRQAIEGNRLGDIGFAVQEVAESCGFSVVREYVGHGIGREMHEAPQIPNYGPPDSGKRIKNGNVFALEPMINAGDFATKVLDDGWTVVTRDGSLSAHFEHTVAVTPDGPEILTVVGETEAELVRLAAN